MATKKKKQLAETGDWPWPKVEKGSHLTVTTYEDGETKLEWDDKALLDDVNRAILEHESKSTTTSSTKKRKKK